MRNTNYSPLSELRNNDGIINPVIFTKTRANCHHAFHAYCTHTTLEYKLFYLHLLRHPNPHHTLNHLKRNRRIKKILKFVTLDTMITERIYLTIISRARMGSEPIAREAEGRMGFDSKKRGHEGKRNNCFRKIQLVGQKYREKTTLGSKTRFSRHCFGFQSRCFSLLVGYNI